MLARAVNREDFIEIIDLIYKYFLMYNKYFMLFFFCFFCFCFFALKQIGTAIVIGLVTVYTGLWVKEQ